MNSGEVRAAFLDFFHSKGHEIVPSAPMVIKDDPTLMFTNAGMNQFKDIFLGNRKPKTVRVCDSQKCLRVSGKQNDLEEVGHDTYHHTMFEMLGNWSFGDYFKKEVIGWAWELLTERLGIDKEKLYVTVFEGSEKLGLGADDEARGYWLEHVPEARVLYGNAKDNFWEMGDTGPCGPCSEIHIDLRSEEERAKVPGRDLVNKDHPEVIEIWNLVFMQYNRKADGSLEPLPAKNVDTGMGFERLCRVLQGKKSNYDTDIFQDIIAKISELSGVKYKASEETDVALRVVADHVRAVAFSIADGQLPSNNKAGYVIRRILRRAVRYGYSFLGFREPFMCQLVPTLIRQMGDSYPELKAQERLIESVMREEEQAFLRTLESGIHLLENKVDALKREHKTTLDGETAFKLYDTYGFPLDLTELMLREQQMTVDGDGFERCMAEQKERSRSAAETVTGDWVVVREGTNTEFVGYDALQTPVHILRMRTVSNKKGADIYQVVLDKSPFYAEQGGQVGDTGSLVSTNERLEVLGCVKENGLPVLLLDKLPEKPEAEFEAYVDTERRKDITAHHTATHLLHYALRHVLGKHVEQRGSLVEADHLRFDFSHFQKMTPSEIRDVETMVNQLVRSCFARDERRSVPIQEAQKLGAMALFGEKYGDRVRVMQFGPSVELCGGTHVANTGEIGLFRIVSEGAIAAGIRRIEAVVGKAAEQRDYAMSETLGAIDELLHAQGNALAAVQTLHDENAALRKKLEHYKVAELHAIADKLFAAADIEDGVSYVSAVLKDMSADDLREIGTRLCTLAPKVGVVLGSVIEGKPLLLVCMSEALSKSGAPAAGAIVKEVGKLIGGGGGGQAHFASAGGKNAAGLEEAVKQASQKLQGK